MIYDCTIFFKEIDLLEFRIKYMMNYVDKFVIAESDKTFTGIPKPYYLESSLERISKIIDLDRIIYKKVITPFNGNPWDSESFQRNNSLPDNFSDDDIIYMGDIDEFPNFHSIPNNIEDWCTYRCNQSLSYYKFNNILNNLMFYGTHICRGKILRNRTVDFVRRNDISSIIIQNGGWGFSYIGTKEEIISKIEAFSHSEFNTNEVKDNLQSKIDTLTDPFNRSGILFSVADINTYPEIILKYMKEYPEWIA